MRRNVNAVDSMLDMRAVLQLPDRASFIATELQAISFSVMDWGSRDSYFSHVSCMAFDMESALAHL